MGPKTKAKTKTSSGAAGPAESYSYFDDQSVDGDGDPSYRVRRDRNNVAVKKSREKSRQRARETAEKMARLRQENEELEQRTVELARELRTLKDVLLTRAGRRNRTGDTSSSTSSSASASTSGSRTTVALADPQTVSKDHEYVMFRGNRTSAAANVERGVQADSESFVELEESIVILDSGDYYI